VGQKAISPKTFIFPKYYKMFMNLGLMPLRKPSIIAKVTCKGFDLDESLIKTNQYFLP
jgi:hypothetical protein